MADERKGFLTPEQEKQLDELIKLEGIAEALDGPAISLVDNQGLERLKKQLVDRFGEEALAITYQIIDTLLAALPQKK